MAGLNLSYDEGVILESELNDVFWMSKDLVRIEKIYLTNKNIYWTYRKSNGLFAKSTDEVIKRPLSDIKIINGQPMVTQGKNNRFGACLQIQFMQGTEQFVFNSSPRKSTPRWINELWKILVGMEAPEEIRKKPSVLGSLGLDLDSLGLGGLNSIASNIKNAASSAKQAVTDTARQAVVQTSTTYENKPSQSQMNYQSPMAPLTFTEPVQTMQTVSRPSGGFCSSCGARLDAGARFCSGCGSPVGGVAPVNQNPPPVPATTIPAVPVSAPDITIPPAPAPAAVVPPAATVNPKTRQQEYAGIIIKCPNCGQSISNTVVICPSCGHQITGRAASSSVQRLQAELMEIDKNFNKNRRGLLSAVMLSGENKQAIIRQKITLIGSFPIPNTIEEIAEFVILASGNINVSISKMSLSNRLDRWGVSNTADDRGLSDAWVGKMQQAYQKAELMFSDQPVFAKIKEIYTKKMKELKIK